MSAKAKKLVNNWSKPIITEERVQVTLRLDFDTYAKLHALKAVYPARSVNEFMNDLLSTSLNEVIEEFGEPQEGGEAFHENGEYLGVASENNAYLFDRTYNMILRDGKNSDLIKAAKESEAKS